MIMVIFVMTAAMGAQQLVPRSQNTSKATYIDAPRASERAYFAQGRGSGSVGWLVFEHPGPIYDRSPVAYGRYVAITWPKRIARSLRLKESLRGRQTTRPPRLRFNSISSFDRVCVWCGEAVPGARSLAALKGRYGFESAVGGRVKSITASPTAVRRSSLTK
jgi:hypothetical protein